MGVRGLNLHLPRFGGPDAVVVWRAHCVSMHRGLEGYVYKASSNTFSSPLWDLGGSWM